MSDARSAVRPAIWMVSGAFTFALMGALTHALGTRCDWRLIALVRAGFMFVSMVLLARLAGVRLVFWTPRVLWVRSLAGSFSLVCSFYSLTRLPVAEVLTLTSTYPIWIVLLSWWSLRKVPTVEDLIVVASGILGVALVEQPKLGQDHFAALVALVGAISTAVAMMGLHRLRELDARAVVAHFAGVASVAAGAWLIGRGDLGAVVGSIAADRGTPWLLLGVGLTGTVGQYFLTRAYAYGAPSELSVLALTQVVFAMGLDAAIWARTMPPVALAGSVLILAPTAWITRRMGKRPIVGAPASAPDGP
jgi:drug/metabolite transporter (DMT)-like permease